MQLILTAAPMSRPGVPNNLIVVCEDWGVDQLPGEQWGSDAMAIPVLDAMGNRGVQFTRAWNSHGGRWGDGTCDDGLESIDCITAGGIPLVEATDDGGWIVATDCGDGCSSIDHNLSNVHYRWTQLTIQAGATDPGSMMRDQWAALDLANQAAQWFMVTFTVRRGSA